MAAKVRHYRGSWWVMTHAQGKRYRKRVGPKVADKRIAEDIAKRINGALALGLFDPNSGAEQKPIPVDARLRAWHQTYSPTFKASFEHTSRSVIEKHLAPHFGSKDVRAITEEDLLHYIRAKLNAGLKPATIRNEQNGRTFWLCPFAAGPHGTITRDFGRHWTPIHLDFIVDDVDKAVERALAAGGHLDGEIRRMEPEPIGCLSDVANLSDPSGNGVDLLQRHKSEGAA